MIIDAFSLPDNDVLESDICIVGAGAAGITLALELIHSPLKVLVLESGGLNMEHASQWLYKGDVSGRPYGALEFTRRRQFGGSTTTWFGRCRPLDAIDFEERSWLPHSGWPVSAQQLIPYYRRVRQICQLEDFDDGSAGGLSHKLGSFHIEQAGLEPKVFQFSPPTKFGETYHMELENASNIQILLHSNAVHLQLNPRGRKVVSIHCRTLKRRKFQAKARIFVLAAGGLEVARLLLASNDVQMTGIGNQNDLLGRFFMEHPHVFTGVVTDLPQDLPVEFTKLNYDVRQKNLGIVHAIGIPEHELNGKRLLNACAFLVRRPAYKTEDSYFSKGASAVMKVADMLYHTTAPSPAVFRWISESLWNAPTVLKMISNAARYRSSPKHLFSIRIQTETIPNAESRVTLSNRKDALGLPRLRLQWRLTHQDLASFRYFSHLLHERLTAAGFRLRTFQHDLDDQGWPISMLPAKHHMGTTRMNNDPMLGVVNADCRVHGTDNLYVAGGSVFPTSGMANPTFTIVALAVRLAAHIKNSLEG